MTPHDHGSLHAAEEQLERIRRARLDLEFRRLAGGDTSGVDAAALSRNERSILEDPAYLERLHSAGSPDSSPEAQHRARVLARDALSAAVRTDPDIDALTRSIEGRVAAFRPWVNGQPARSADVRFLLRSEPDGKLREAAWLARAPLGAELEGDVAALFALRNGAARTHGFAGFAELAFEAAGIERIDYLALCDELEQLTRSRFEESLGQLRELRGGATLEPWDLDYGLDRLAQGAGTVAGGHNAGRDTRAEPGPAGSTTPPSRLDVADISARFAAIASGWGIDAGRLPVTFHDADPGDGALCLPVDPAADIRILGDFRNDAASLEAAVGALGTAVHHHAAAEQPAVFARDRSPLPEATGLLAARRIRGDEPLRVTAARLYRLRRRIADSLFEILAYEKPAGDLHSLHCEIAEHYLGFPRHPESLWAADGALVSRPLGSVRHVLADVVAADLHAALERTAGSALSVEAGQALRRDVWAPGDSVPWTERLRSLTGGPVDPGALLRELGADDIP